MREYRHHWCRFDLVNRCPQQCERTLQRRCCLATRLQQQPHEFPLRRCCLAIRLQQQSHATLLHSHQRCEQTLLHSHQRCEQTLLRRCCLATHLQQQSHEIPLRLRQQYEQPLQTQCLPEELRQQQCAEQSLWHLQKHSKPKRQHHQLLVVRQQMRSQPKQHPKRRQPLRGCHQHRGSLHLHILGVVVRCSRIQRCFHRNPCLQR